MNTIAMHVFFDRIDSYTKAASTLAVDRAVLYQSDLDEKRLKFLNFVKSNMEFPCEVMLVDGDLVIPYVFQDKDKAPVVGDPIEITPFGEEPRKNKAGFVVYGEYPSLKTHKKEVYDYFSKHVTAESKELLLFTTSIPLMKHVPWHAVNVNPKINAGFNKLLLPTGQTRDVDFRAVQKWSNHMGFELEGEKGEDQTRKKDINIIKFNGYSYREAAKERERMNQGDFSPTKLKKMESKARENPPPNTNALMQYTMLDEQEKELRKKAARGMECNSCPIQNSCPAFQEDALCAFEDDIQALSKMFETRDKDAIADGLSMIMQSETSRYARQALMEKLSGNMSAETRKTADSIFKNAQTLLEILTPKDSSPQTNIFIQNNKNYNIGKVSEHLNEIPAEARKQILGVIEETLGEAEPSDFTESS